MSDLLSEKTVDERHDELLEALYRIANELESHSKVVSKCAHVLGFRVKEAGEKKYIDWEGVVR